MHRSVGVVSNAQVAVAAVVNGAQVTAVFSGAQAGGADGASDTQAGVAALV